MADWKKELQLKVDTMIESRKTNDFNSVVATFKKRFTELFKPLIEKDKTLFKESKRENYYFQFNIYKYGISLAEKGDFIVICKTLDIPGGIKRDEIGVITFKDGFALFQYEFELIDDNSKEFFTKKHIDELFEIAFKPLIEA
ncbi:hypothetical protein ABEU81_00315 [Priestia megaterium]